MCPLIRCTFFKTKIGLLRSNGKAIVRLRMDSVVYPWPTGTI